MRLLASISVPPRCPASTSGWSAESDSTRAITRRCSVIFSPLSMQSCSSREGIPTCHCAVSPPKPLYLKGGGEPIPPPAPVPTAANLSSGGAAPSARTEADLLGKLAALAGIVGRHHGIVGRQIPTLAIVVRAEIVGGLEVALQHLELFAVLEADDVVRMHRALDVDRRQRPFHGCRRRLADAGQRLVNLIDQLRQVADRHGIV